MCPPLVFKIGYRAGVCPRAVCVQCVRPNGRAADSPYYNNAGQFQLDSGPRSPKLPLSNLSALPDKGAGVVAGLPGSHGDVSLPGRMPPYRPSESAFGGVNRKGAASTKNPSDSPQC